jgi:DNA-binding XRE family transcriptional regulator
MEKKNDGYRLVNLREKAGVTQKQLAEVLQVTDHTIRNWEKGRAEAKLEIWQVKEMCRLLKCDIWDLPDSFKEIG